MKEGRYFVYGLVDPRDGLIHYIGRSINGLREYDEDKKAEK